MHNKSTKKNQKRVSKKSIALLILLIAFIILGLVLRTSLFRAKVIVASGSSYNTKGEQKSTTSNSRDKKNTTPSSRVESQKSTGTPLTLQTPSGDFVSNHHPNLSGSPAPNTISSVCNTTPGASCKITFTQGEQVKALPSQTIDGNGSTYWNWKLQDVGIGSGSWKVQAIASLDSNTTEASDSMNLVVAQ